MTAFGNRGCLFPSTVGGGGIPERAEIVVVCTYGGGGGGLGRGRGQKFLFFRVVLKFSHEVVAQFGTISCSMKAPEGIGKGKN